eukprot:scpid57520/ scgid16551/ 
MVASRIAICLVVLRFWNLQLELHRTLEWSWTIVCLSVGSQDDLHAVVVTPIDSTQCHVSSASPAGSNHIIGYIRLRSGHSVPGPGRRTAMDTSGQLPHQLEGASSCFPGLQTFARASHDITVLPETDNTVAVAYVNHQAGRTLSRQLCQPAKDICT